MKNLALLSSAALLGALAIPAHAVPPGSSSAAAPATTSTTAPPAATTTTTSSTSTTTSTTAVAPKAGDVVYDNTGQQAGSVESVNGDVVVVATEQGKGSMPLTEFAMGAKGLMMNHTKAELETAIRNARGAQGTAPQAPTPDGEAAKAATR